MRFSELSIKQFCVEVAKDSAVPAGGCVSALSAALGASLLEMSAALTLRKAAKNGIPADGKIAEGCVKAAEAKLRLQTLIDEDAAAFDAVMVAITMPKDTDEQKMMRMDAAQTAYRQATKTLTDIAEITLALLPYADAVIKKGDPAVTSDATVAIRMLHAGISGAVSGIRANIFCLKDASEAAGLSLFADKAEADAELFLKTVLAGKQF